MVTAKKVIAKVAAVGVVLTATVGVLHLPFMSPLLHGLIPASVCPIKPGTPEQVDDSYRFHLAEMKRDAKTEAPARPALVWRLDVSTKDDLMTWAAKNQVACSAINGTETLQRCTNVPASAVGQPSEFGPLEDISFAFRSSGGLISVSTTRRGLSALEASRISASLDAEDASRLGQPTKRAGETTPEYLERGFLSTYVAEYDFTDYRASITATNLAPTGIMVREQYLSLN